MPQVEKRRSTMEKKNLRTIEADAAGLAGFIVMAEEFRGVENVVKRQVPRNAVVGDGRRFKVDAVPNNGEHVVVACVTVALVLAKLLHHPFQVLMMCCKMGFEKRCLG
jgi:hypothetical protein